MRGQKSPSRILLLVLAFAAPATAQFQDLATSDDGAHLYFSSPLRLQGTDASGYDKIFRFVTGEAFQPFAEANRMPDPNYSNRSNFYRLYRPDVSGDGSVVSYGELNDCIGGSGCMFVLRNRSRIVGARAALPLDLDGKVRLTRNGRYALQSQTETVFPEINLIDLTSGERIAISRNRGGQMGRQPLTGDGRAVLIGLNGTPGISLWSASDVRQITSSESPASASINDAGTWIIYEAATPQNTYDLHSIRVADGTDTVLATGAASSYGATITNAGDMVLYVDNQVFTVNPDGTGQKQLTNAADGITAAVISGCGNLAYAATGIGRILRIDPATGATEELVGRTPVITSVTGASVPGSMNFIRGSALSDTTAIDGVQVRLGDTPLPLLLVSPSEIRYQIPFEMQTGDAPLQLSSGNSVFEQPPHVLPVSEYMPTTMQFGVELPPGPALDVVIHSDFQSLVTYDNPARAGEVVHTYMTGLGQVNPPVKTGVPTPLEPLSTPVQPFTCSEVRNGVRIPREVLFAGLAPTLTGIYQVSVRMPPDPQPFETDPNRGMVFLICGAPDLPETCYPGPGCPSTYLNIPVRP